MRLTEIPGPLADPAAASPGATLGCVSLVTFFAQAKKVTRATLCLCFKTQKQDQEHPSSILPCAARKGGGKSRSSSKIKMDPSVRWDDD